jgi:hypothetical protein
MVIKNGTFMAKSHAKEVWHSWNIESWQHNVRSSKAVLIVQKSTRPMAVACVFCTHPQKKIEN